MRTRLRAYVLLAVLAAGGSAPLTAQEKVLVNTDKSGLALKGYDPVSYFEGGGPKQGTAEFAATHQRATYRFVSAANRDRFVADPSRYAPQFGGYCGWAASRNYLAPGDPLAYAVMEGRLILQYSQDVLKRWRQDPAGRLKLADQNWPGLVEKEGKP